MDVRDLPAGAAAGVAPAVQGSGREGQVEDDEEVLTVTCKLAKDAALLFQGGRYEECIEVLNQILLKKEEEDPKVLHNIAIAEYFYGGCSDPRKLLDVLNRVKKMSEDLNCASIDGVDAAGGLGSNATVASKASTGSPHQISSVETRSAYADGLDASVVTFNTAVILFHLHKYSNALELLGPLYQKLQPLDETVALHVCLLLVDVALASNDASRAADVIQYIEKSFGVGHVNQGENGNIVQHHSSSHTAKVAGASSASTVPDTASSDSSASENTLDRSLSEDAIEYENLLSTLDNSGQSILQSNQNGFSRISNRRPVSGIDLKLKLHLFKVRLLLLTRNLKAAKREVKVGMNVGRDSSTTLLLKSQLEYARRNNRKAIKLLMASMNKTEPGVVSLFNNNLGCIYHQLQKHHTSIALFSKALRSSSSMRTEKPLKLSTFSQDKSLFIMYNCGLQNLACGKPLMAACCFHKATPFFYNQPLLWLRLAECCILALENGLLRPAPSSSSGSAPINIHVVGTGKWRQLAIDRRERNGYSESVVKSGILRDDDECILSIPFAKQCLLNALHLLNRLEPNYDGIGTITCAASKEDDSSYATNACNKSLNPKNVHADDSKISNAISDSADTDSKESKGTAGPSAVFQTSISAYEVTCRKENYMVKQAVLADLAYIELSLENPLRALSFAKALQNMPDCSRVYAFFSCLYAAEALCHLNRPAEAAECLAVYISRGDDAELPFSEGDREMLNAYTAGDGEESNGFTATKATGSVEPKCDIFLRPDEACGMLYVNLAVNAAMQDDLERAKQFTRKALDTVSNNPQVLLAVAYVDLRLGNASDAIAKLKQCGHVRFFP